MLEFTLEGEVGWEIDEWSVKNILSKANGEDIKINFSSNGGSVFTGFTIFNLFKNYSGNVDFHIIGRAQSMGSYIPLVARRITAEPNAVFMIHNAGSYASGDHNKLRKISDILEGLSDIVAKEYSNRTGTGIPALKKMMDEETWFFGQDMVDSGFVDEIIGEPDSDPQAKQNALALAKESFHACMKKVKAEKPDDYEQAAAFMPKAVKNNVVETKTAQSGKTKKGAFMNLEKLKADHPEIYNAAVAVGMVLGATDAITKERDRVKAFLVLGEKSGDMETAVTAIKDGSEVTMELNASFMMTAVNNRDIKNKEEEDNDADPLKPKATENGADDVSKDVKDVIALVKGKTGFQEAK